MRADFWKPRIDFPFGWTALSHYHDFSHYKLKSSVEACACVYGINRKRNVTNARCMAMRS